MTATATEMKNKFGAYLDEVQNGPVTVEKNNRPRAVLISYDEYQRLQEMEDYYWLQRASDAEKSGYVGADEAMEFVKLRLSGS